MIKGAIEIFDSDALFIFSTCVDSAGANRFLSSYPSAVSQFHGLRSPERSGMGGVKEL